MKKHFVFLILITIIILQGCNYFNQNNLQNVGMLFDSEIESNTWDDMGYEGLLKIKNEFDVDVFYKENVRTEREVRLAVDELVEEGVNLIIGHSNIFGNFFVDIAKAYPEVHFIYTNGGIYNQSITSLNFDSHAMGFFGGMVAGEMTEAEEIGVIAVYSWQPELEGFYEGVKFQNPDANLHIDFVNDWSDGSQATLLYEEFKDEGIDIIFPAGNSFSEEIIQTAADDGIYSIGYIADQQEIAPDYVLMSMVQHIDKLYLDGVEAFRAGDIEGGIQTYDFQNDFISISGYNDIVPEGFQQEIEEKIEAYIETGLLPNERK